MVPLHFGSLSYFTNRSKYTFILHHTLTVFFTYHRAFFASRPTNLVSSLKILTNDESKLQCNNTNENNDFTSVENDIRHCIFITVCSDWYHWYNTSMNKYKNTIQQKAIIPVLQNIVWSVKYRTCIKIQHNIDGLVAQWLGRWIRDWQVHGSIPSRCTTNNSGEVVHTYLPV